VKRYLQKSLLGITMGIVLQAPVVALANGESIHFLIEKATYWQMHGRDDLAIDAWKQVLFVKPDSEEALASIATLAAQSGNHVEAQKYLQLLKAKAPGSPKISQVENALRLGPQSNRLIQQAGSLQARGEAEAALRKYQEALGGGVVPPNLASGYFEALIKTPGGKAAAISRLRKLIHNYPQDPQYAIVLGRLLTYDPTTRAEGIGILSNLALGNTAAAAAARISWRQALVWDGSAPMAIPLLKTYLRHYSDSVLADQLHRAEMAAVAMRRGVLQRALSARQTAMLVQERAGYSALHQGHLHRASRIFKSLLSKHPNNVHYLNGLAAVRMAQGNFPQAIALYQQAQTFAAPQKRGSLDQRIRQARTYAILALAGKTEASGEDALALHYYQKALELSPDSVSAQEGLAAAYSRQKQYAKAIAIYRQLVAFPSGHQPNPGVWIGFISTLQAAGHYREALLKAQSIPNPTAAAVRKDPAYWASLGAVYSGLHDYTQAEASFENAMHYGAAASPALQLQLAWTLYNAGDSEHLQRVLNRLGDRRLDPAQTDQLNTLRQMDAEQRANKALQLGHYSQAKAILEAAYAQDPGDPAFSKAITGLDLAEAWRLYHLGDDRALYALLIRLHGESTLTVKQRQQVNALFRYGADREAGSLVKSGQYRVAATIYQNMIALFNHAPYYRRQLANVYLAAGRPSYAYRLYRDAGPGNTPGSYAAAAGAALGAGASQQAMIWIHQGLARWPGDAPLLRVGAQIAEAEGDRLAALHYYERMLQIFPKEHPSAVDLPSGQAEPLPPFAGDFHG